jgi:hypothetical protein
MHLLLRGHLRLLWRHLLVWCRCLPLVICLTISLGHRVLSDLPRGIQRDAIWRWTCRPPGRLLLLRRENARVPMNRLGRLLLRGLLLLLRIMLGRDVRRRHPVLLWWRLRTGTTSANSCITFACRARRSSRWLASRRCHMATRTTESTFVGQCLPISRMNIFDRSGRLTSYKALPTGTHKLGRRTCSCWTDGSG